MSTASKDTKKHWMIFALSMVATVAFLIILPEWFWVMLPFVFTSFIQGMDWM